MMVTFVSQCEKNALKKTRRVLDAFANRIGDNVWQTLITREGLLAVKKLLRRTASKNTAVSCHWFRSRSRSELLWVVGCQDKFDQQGIVPVNKTKVNRVQADDRSDWQYLPLIQSLVAISGLFHDWGKANVLFQQKLSPENKRQFKGDPIRHEWISCLLLSAIVKQSGNELSDSNWLNNLLAGNINEQKIIESVSESEAKPLAELPPAASLVAWLVLTHHRLPITEQDFRTESPKTMESILKKITKAWGYENRYDEKEYQSRVNDCFKFSKGLLSKSGAWLKAVKKWAQRLLDQQALVEQSIRDKTFRVVLHHARLALMLGDYACSSQPADSRWPNTTDLFANTDPATRKLKQKLDEHLVGVAKKGLEVAYRLPVFEQELPVATNITNLKKRSPGNFRWQDKAVEKIKAWQSQSVGRTGFFVVNLASTGCGKTFANAKVMQALSDSGKSLRYVLALGLRTLTLQTGDEYRNKMGLDNTELAVLIGSKTIMELHQQQKIDEQQDSFENSGSLSQEPLFDDDIDFELDGAEELLEPILKGKREKQFLSAPVLACTIDYMMAATETIRSGGYILPSLRLLSSDLVIDEIDDFTGDDLIAIGRLIHLAGMLGRKVMISSATIPPDMAEGYFKAYRDGWRLYHQTRDVGGAIGCAFIDEFQTSVITNGSSDLRTAIKDYRKAQNEFINRRVKELKKEPVKRRADITVCHTLTKTKPDTNDQLIKISKTHGYFNLMAASALVKHQSHHTVDNKTGLLVSFGMMRMANIQPCVRLTHFLLEHQWPETYKVRVMAYHSQQVLLLRHKQEQYLDRVLKRKEAEGKQPDAFTDPVIRHHLDTIKTQYPEVLHVSFMLVCTPVEEVGRDHCFDWAVVEPSSFRSLIQLAGRIRRHRISTGSVEQAPNIAIMQYNLKGLLAREQPDKKVFVKPGFEEALLLEHHNMDALIDVKAIGQRLDAVPRIQKLPTYTAGYFDTKRRSNNKASSLAELEHYATWLCLTNYQQSGPDGLQGYLQETWFLTGLPQKLTRFRSGSPSKRIFLSYDSDSDDCVFCELGKDGKLVVRESVLNISRAELSGKSRDNLWLERNFKAELESQADRENKSLVRVSTQMGEMSFPDYGEGDYRYCDQLGLVKVNNKTEG